LHHPVLAQCHAHVAVALARVDVGRGEDAALGVEHHDVGRRLLALAPHHAVQRR
jgi:hypothetical protein